MLIVAIFIVLVLAYSLISRSLERTPVTGPILFTATGLCLSYSGVVEADVFRNMDTTLRIAEVGLSLLLFTDASRTDLGFLKSIRSLPTRLLSVGLLLTIALGALAAKLVFPNLTWWEAGILGAIVAPTDAGLGQVIVTSPRVPMRIRQALNVEAGLNDGLSVPFLMFFIALTGTASGSGSASLTRFIIEQLGYGLVVGVAIGLVGGAVLGVATRKGWMAEHLRGIGVVTLPLLCIVASEAVGASMFIAAFVAGLAIQIGYKEAGEHSVEFSDQWGQFLNFFVFFLFGLLIQFPWTWSLAPAFVYAALSLTVVRMVPVAISLIGTRLDRPTVLFMGWFGPRGLASIVLGLVYIEQEAHLPGEQSIRMAVGATVLVSIFAHGLSALPGINMYSRTQPADAT
ncbi:MAG TPA: cation:proton antiporter [Blastocatellia bacterium]|nr:cation:proton antiporter [Blastocatellia bacterium]